MFPEHSLSEEGLHSLPIIRSSTLLNVYAYNSSVNATCLWTFGEESKSKCCNYW